MEHDLNVHISHSQNLSFLMGLRAHLIISGAKPSESISG